MLILLLFCLIGCKKEPQSECKVCGEWVTLAPTFAQWEYKIDEDGLFCRKLPEVFQNTTFCYDFGIMNYDSILVKAEVEEWYVFKFETEDVAVLEHHKDGQLSVSVVKKK